MAVDYANCFATLGKIGKSLYASVNTAQATYDDALEEIADAQDDQIARDAIADLLTLDTLKNWRDGVASIAPQLQAAAQAVLIDYVKADKPAKAGSVEDAIAELRRQMIADSESVKAATVSVTATALTTNSGTGGLVTTVKRGDGLQQDLTVPETGFLTCTADSQIGGSNERSETFTFVGEVDDGDTAMFDWPTGSGASATMTVCDPTLDNDGGNVLTNSDFEDWTGSPLAATGWGTSPVVGVWGTDIARATVPLYSDGVYGISFNGDGSTLSEIRQKFNDSSVGTAGVLLPQRSYAVGFWAKVLSSAPAAGIMTVKLVDGNGTTINDDAGTANSTTFAITGWTTSYVFKSIVFRTPKLLPDTYYLDVKISTAITNAKTAYINGLGVSLMDNLYDGGPSVKIFPGATKWVANDGWTLANANNFATATYASGNFQSLFDLWFDMRGQGQLLPTSGSPTRANTLITA